MGPSSTIDKQKEAAWRMEFEALGERSVLKNVKHDDTYNETKRQAAFRWLSEQASCGTAAKHGPFSWHGALFVSMAAALIGIMGVLMALH